MYCYSSHVVPYPKTWPPATFVTGYWFLGKPAKWEPSAELLRFLEAGPPPVYVDFTGSDSGDSTSMLRTVVGALKKAGQRGIIPADGKGDNMPGLPDTVHVCTGVPHSWLLQQVDAVVHSGGAGTTGAGLAAGKPTVVCPYEADQFFWAKVVENLGVGPRAIPLRKLTRDTLAQALLVAVSDGKMRKRAAAIGEGIRSENGVRRAIEVINSEMISWRFPQLCNTR
jgi:sterol 3beta-glucosyltransferase